MKSCTRSERTSKQSESGILSAGGFYLLAMIASSSNSKQKRRLPFARKRRHKTQRTQRPFRGMKSCKLARSLSCGGVSLLFRCFFLLFFPPMFIVCASVSPTESGSTLWSGRWETIFFASNGRCNWKWKRTQIKR